MESGLATQNITFEIYFFNHISKKKKLIFLVKEAFFKNKI